MISSVAHWVGKHTLVFYWPIIKHLFEQYLLMNGNVISWIYVCTSAKYPVTSPRNTLNFGTGKSALVLVDQSRVLLERGSLGITGAC
jgi:hypothetical protein